jgi:hypothetical protein
LDSARQRQARSDADAKKPHLAAPRFSKPPSDGSIPSGCAKPLAALAGVYPAGMTEPQWAIAAGYKRSGGTWGAYKSRLLGARADREARWQILRHGSRSGRCRRCRDAAEARSRSRPLVGLKGSPARGRWPKR